MDEFNESGERRPPRVEVRIAVLENEVKHLGEEVHGIQRALWAVAGSIIVGVITFALAVASGVIGH